MNQITRWDISLPIEVQRELDNRLNSMNYICQLTGRAIDEESSIYSYAFFKTLSTMKTISLLKQLMKADGVSPEVEAWFEESTERYLAEMEKLPRVASDKIIQMLERIILG